MKEIFIIPRFTGEIISNLNETKPKRNHQTKEENVFQRLKKHKDQFGQKVTQTPRFAEEA